MRHPAAVAKTPTGGAERAATAPKHSAKARHNTQNNRRQCVRAASSYCAEKTTAGPARAVGCPGPIYWASGDCHPKPLRLDARNHQDSPLWGGRGRGAGKAARSWSGRTKCGRQRACIGTRPISGWRSDYAGGPDTAQNRQQRRPNTQAGPSCTPRQTPVRLPRDDGWAPALPRCSRRPQTRRAPPSTPHALSAASAVRHRHSRGHEDTTEPRTAQQRRSSAPFMPTLFSAAPAGAGASARRTRPSVV